MSKTTPQNTIHIWRTALHDRFVRGAVSQFGFEFVIFGVMQAWACLFGGLMLALLVGTYFFYPQGAILARYDFIVIMAVFIQIMLLVLRLETLEEAKVILIFHIVGTVMEIFKTHMGSWSYPEPSLLRIGGVPLFTGFMYACIGSYIARVWRIFDFRFDHFTPLKWQGLLAVLIYINFFAHHYMPDIRLGLFVASVLIYGRTIIWFKADEVHRPMPLIFGLFIVALFIWLAENIGTLTKTWAYPNQETGWHMVSFGKLGAWYLLMLISFVLVAWVHNPIRGAGLGIRWRRD
ncbi:MAG: DUF817 domain-containing protein [Robiginitomaculum sp.]